MRNHLTKRENEVLFASTYEAGKFVSGAEWEEEEKELRSDEPMTEAEEQAREDDIAKKRVLRGYKQQCKLVKDPLRRLLKVFISRGESVIVEGVHVQSNVF